MEGNVVRLTEFREKLRQQALERAARHRSRRRAWTLLAAGVMLFWIAVWAMVGAVK